MKALTIQQPYAHLIVTPQENLPRGQFRKRIENRVWPTTYRGWIAIHSGKGTKYLRSSGWPGTETMRRDPKATDFPEMTFGAIVGMARLTECVLYEELRRAGHVKESLGALSREQVNDLSRHVHAEGPWCWVLEDAFQLERPIAVAGSQKLWDVPYDMGRRLIEQVDRYESTRRQDVHGGALKESL